MSGTAMSRLGVRQSGGVADGRYVYHADHLGSVHAITDDLQATVQTYGYEAFGRVRWATGLGPVGGNRFTYTGREPVGDTAGWYYYRWRVMDPTVGRFTSEDPLGFVDGVNVYGYVGNRPVRSTDGLGLFGSNVNRPPPLTPSQCCLLAGGVWGPRWLAYGNISTCIAMCKAGATGMGEPLAALVGGGFGFVVGRRFPVVGEGVGALLGSFLGVAYLHLKCLHWCQENTCHLQHPLNFTVVTSW